ncbi:MAG: alpha/beta hydrolase [Cyanobacteria bacterium P01_C01_bin.69]
MQKKPDVLWLSVSPYLKCFDQRLMSQLTKRSTVRRWKYCQTIDEPCSADAVVEALHEYLSNQAAKADAAKSKVHLIGHGVSGVVGLLYARRYPQHVASLTLLSVSSSPAVNWQAHYYALRKLLPCSREVILGQLTRLLFGPQAPRFTTALSQLLLRDLDSNLTLHSLAHQTHIPAGGVEVPLLVCSGEIDDVVSSQQQGDWTRWLKTGDRIWHCPKGRHFFHFYHYKAVAKTISGYWSQLALPSNDAETTLPADSTAAADSAPSLASESTQSSVSWC